jgi:hypothetical protein
MQHRSEIEKAFYEDIREKKKAASGVHSRTGKRGYVGKMLFATDFMSRKEKYNYRKAGRVMTSNMYDEILELKDFEELEQHEQRNRFQYWRSKYNNEEIKNGLGIHNAKLYNIIDALGLPKAEKNNKGKRKAKAAGKAEPKAEPKAAKEEAKVPQVAAEKQEPNVAEPEQQVQTVIVNGLSLIYNGDFTAEHIQKQLQKIITLIDGETDNFYVELKLMQKV